MSLRGAMFALLLTLTSTSCGKVPIVPVNAFFSLADASWFAEEETLFVFYDVSAEQGLGDPSVIEVRYTTDDEVVDWTPVSELTTVHTHEDVDCGSISKCGSSSIHVPIEPRNVAVRLRYHRDGALALDAATVFNVVGPGAAYSHRSLLVYGVFDELNERVQWRTRHQFPTLRNQQVRTYGLRRAFTIRDQTYGTVDGDIADNPYAYGAICPDSFVDMPMAEVQTNDAAKFNPDLSPLAASDSASVCAESEVTDAKGVFVTGAVARKNPEVRPAFPLLRSPVHDARQLKFFLGPCDRVISAQHEEMQRQRLGMEDTETYCIDDWAQDGFMEELVVDFREAIEAARPQGEDMVLVIALSQDEEGVPELIEKVLSRIVPDERHRSSPRLAGAFVLGSVSRNIVDADVSQVTLWCPASFLITGFPDASERTCATLPAELTGIDLGPFSFGTLPVLPSREQYLKFIDDFSVGQAGDVENLRFRTPEFSTTSDHVDFGEFGVVTFLNGENFASDSDDAFSYCWPEFPSPVVFRSPLMQNPQAMQALALACGAGLVDFELCTAAGTGLLPVESLPAWHNLVGESTYEVGLFWDFPFLLQLEYKAVVAGSITAFGLSVPFGIASPEKQTFGTEQWHQQEFPLDPDLLQCRRYCDHPTFDSASVYHVTDTFRAAYARNCYQPLFPSLGDSGFPLDP
jgi:hypothetical protein